jgi:hypothetical protein
LAFLVVSLWPTLRYNLFYLVLFQSLPSFCGGFLCLAVAVLVASLL